MNIKNLLAILMAGIILAITFSAISVNAAPDTPVSSYSNPTPSGGTITATVNVPFVVVTVSGSGLSWWKNSYLSGSVTINHILIGVIPRTYTVTATKLGYSSDAKTVTLNKFNPTASVSFTLTEEESYRSFPSPSQIIPRAHLNLILQRLNKLRF